MMSVDKGMEFKISLNATKSSCPGKFDGM
jgi:hypothetical protein